MIAEGRYLARATTDHGLTETKNGHLRYEILFEILDTNQKPSGEIVRWSGLLDGGDWEERTLSTLKTCGWNGVDIERVGALSNVVRVKVRHREWNGRTNAEVSFVDPVATPPSTGKVADLAARIRARNGAPAPAPARTAPWGSR